MLYRMMAVFSGALVLAVLPTVSARADDPPAPSSTDAPFPVTFRNVWFLKMDDGRYAACIDFVNASQKAETAIRFEFAFLDAFDEPTFFHGDRLGEFSPGVLIQGPADLADFNMGVGGGTFGGGLEKVRNCWAYYVNDVPQRVKVAVSHVVFWDGSTWTNPELKPGAHSVAGDTLAPR